MAKKEKRISFAREAHTKTSSRLARLTLVVGVCALGVLLCLAVKAQTDLSLEQAKRNYQQESHEEASRKAEAVSNTMQRIYQGLRTIARLPGVRDIENNGRGLTPDTNAAIQEIYNNLYENVTISELYIVPVEFDPDSIDPQTGEHQKPSATFDHLLGGRQADQVGEATDVAEADAPLEEIEIHEYRLMKRQLEWFDTHFPVEASIHGLGYPAVSGPAVVTCDNSRYSKTNPDDRDRSGLLFSVPFYAPDGRLKGCVTGIVLVPVLSDLLQQPEYAIRHRDYGVTIAVDGDDTWSRSRAHVDAVAPDPTLRFSEVLPISAREEIGQWQLWVGFPDSRYTKRSDVEAALKFEQIGYILALLITFGAFALGWLGLRHYDANRGFLIKLENRVQERTESLSAQTKRLEQEIDERQRAEKEKEKLHAALVEASRNAGKADVATAVLHNIGNTLNSVNLSASQIGSRLKASQVKHLVAVSDLVNEHSSDLATFTTQDDRGKLLPKVLAEIGQLLSKEQEEILEDADSLMKNVEHIKSVINVQQNYAKVTISEDVSPSSLMKDAIRLTAAGLDRHRVEVIEEFDDALPDIQTDKHKVLQILVNLITNAKEAMNGMAFEDRSLHLKTTAGDDGRVRFVVKDNGTGIERDHLAKIFTHGFTTKKDGHGFGLHSSALAASELGGQLSVDSEGPNLGATFILELPIEHTHEQAA